MQEPPPMDATAEVHKLVRFARSLEGSHRIADQPGKHSTLAPLVTLAFISVLSISLEHTQYGYQCEVYLSPVANLW
jgi:hypothetical protein